jgi:chemotaxis signal transduction protein
LSTALSIAAPDPSAVSAAPGPSAVSAPASAVSLRDAARDDDHLFDLFDPSTQKPAPVARPAGASALDAPSAASGARDVRPRTSGDRLPTSLCAFWLGSQCFALDVSLVGEVVTVEQVVPVALSPAPLLGLFNLRGTPVALVNLAAVLEIDGDAESAPEADRRITALVLRPNEVLAAVVIDRMEVVLTKGREVQSLPPTTEDKSFVKGFVAIDDPSRLTVTVLDAPAVVQRLERLKFS